MTTYQLEELLNVLHREHEVFDKLGIDIRVHVTTVLRPSLTYNQ